MKKLIFTISFLFLAACGKQNQNYNVETQNPSASVELKQPSAQLCDEIAANPESDFMVQLEGKSFFMIQKGHAYFWNVGESVALSEDGTLSLGKYCDLKIQAGKIIEVTFAKPAPAPSCGGWFNPCPPSQPTPPPAYGSCGPYPCPPQY